MTRLETAAEVLRWKEARLQTEVMQLATDAGWHVPSRERRELEEQVAAFGLPPEPLPGVVYHDRVAYRSEPGWPDLVMVRRRDRRLLFAELKTETGPVRKRQAEVLDLLRCLETGRSICERATSTNQGVSWDAPRSGVSIQVFVWRPSDYLSGAIAEVLA